MHKKIDKVRNQREDRKLKLKDYEQTDTRRHYINIRDKSRYQKQQLASLATDTGFDVICSSCLQFKTKSYCRLVTATMKDKYKRFIIKYCALLKNRTEGQFLCNLCLNQIRQDKVPKRSHINKFKFANFPESFILKLKQKCKFIDQQSETPLFLMIKLIRENI